MFPDSFFSKLQTSVHTKNSCIKNPPVWGIDNFGKINNFTFNKCPQPVEH